MLLIAEMAETSFRAQVPMPLESVQFFALHGEHSPFLFRPCGHAAQEIFLCSCASGCATSGLLYSSFSNSAASTCPSLLLTAHTSVMQTCLHSLC